MGTYRHACGIRKTHAGVYNERVLSLFYTLLSLSLSLSLSLLYTQIKNIFKKVCDGIGEMVLEVKMFDNLSGF